MRYTSAKQGRVFVIRLEDGEVLQESIENFALKMGICSAKLQLLGGADKGSKLIVGPREGRASVIEPMIHILDEMHEVVGNGTIFLNEQNIPRLHCHVVCGRKDKTICGEIREGLVVWHVMEVIITELVDCDARRYIDPNTGFELLYPEISLE